MPPKSQKTKKLDIQCTTSRCPRRRDSSQRQDRRWTCGTSRRASWTALEEGKAPSHSIVRLVSYSTSSLESPEERNTFWLRGFNSANTRKASPYNLGTRGSKVAQAVPKSSQSFIIQRVTSDVLPEKHKQSEAVSVPRRPLDDIESPQFTPMAVFKSKTFLAP